MMAMGAITSITSLVFETSNEWDCLDMVMIIRYLSGSREHPYGERAGLMMPLKRHFHGACRVRRSCLVGTKLVDLLSRILDCSPEIKLPSMGVGNNDDDLMDTRSVNSLERSTTQASTPVGV